MASLHHERETKKSFSRITISLASSDMILARSHGEGTMPETITSRASRPATEGLCC